MAGGEASLRGCAQDLPVSRQQQEEGPRISGAIRPGRHHLRRRAGEITFFFFLPCVVSLVFLCSLFCYCRQKRVVAVVAIAVDVTSTHVQNRVCGHRTGSHELEWKITTGK